MADKNSKYKNISLEEFKSLDLSSLSKEEFMEIVQAITESEDVHAEEAEDSNELPNLPPWIHFS